MQLLLDLIDSFSSIEISFQEMALAFQSASGKHSINSSFKSTKEIYLIEFSGAG